MSASLSRGVRRARARESCSRARVVLELASEVGVEVPSIALVRDLVEHTFGVTVPGLRRDG